MSATLPVPPGVLIRTTSPSHKNQTGPACGVPLAPTVARMPLRSRRSRAVWSADKATVISARPFVSGLSSQPGHARKRIEEATAGLLICSAVRRQQPQRDGGAVRPGDDLFVRAVQMCLRAVAAETLLKQVI